MVVESLNLPRPPETDGVSGRTFAKVRGCFASSLVNLKTTRGKRAGRWRAVVCSYVHIDDGSMGGGGPVPHEDKIDNEEPYQRAYQSSERKGIFYYCIICHELNSGWGGIGGGDSFSIAGKIADTSSEQVNAFIHELGECILDDTPMPRWFEEKDNGWHCKRESCALYYKLKGGQNYCSDCWTIVDVGQGLQ